MVLGYTVVFDEHVDGVTVTVPALPGVVTEGRTMEEAVVMARDAIRCHVESMLLDGETPPPNRHVETRDLDIEIPAA